MGADGEQCMAPTVGAWRDFTKMHNLRLICASSGEWVLSVFVDCSNPMYHDYPYATYRIKANVLEVKKDMPRLKRIPIRVINQQSNEDDTHLLLGARIDFSEWDAFIDEYIMPAVDESEMKKSPEQAYKKAVRHLMERNSPLEQYPEFGIRTYFIQREKLQKPYGNNLVIRVDGDISKIGERDFENSHKMSEEKRKRHWPELEPI